MLLVVEGRVIADVRIADWLNVFDDLDRRHGGSRDALSDLFFIGFHVAPIPKIDEFRW